MKMIFVCTAALLCSNIAYADLITTNYASEMRDVLRQEINDKADDSAVVHIGGNKEVIKSDKDFSGVVNLTKEIPVNDDSTRAATTGWTRDRIDGAIGLVPVAGSDTPAQIWVQ